MAQPPQAPLRAELGLCSAPLVTCQAKALAAGKLELACDSASSSRQPWGLSEGALCPATLPPTPAPLHLLLRFYPHLSKPALQKGPQTHSHTGGHTINSLKGFLN